MVCGRMGLTQRRGGEQRAQRNYLRFGIGGGWFFARLGGVEVLGEERAEEAEEGGESVVKDFEKGRNIGLAQNDGGNLRYGSNRIAVNHEVKQCRKRRRIRQDRGKWISRPFSRATSLINQTAPTKD